MAQYDETVPGVVIINDSNGHTVVERDSSLKRLHYFDGKFLRAPDMQLEQNALLNQMRISNQAGGSGIVHGFSCLLGGNDTLQLGAGLAIDSLGRLLQLGNEVDVSIADLIARASSSSGNKDDCQCQDAAGSFGDCEKMVESGQADTVLAGETLYLISLHYVEAYCGEEDVYGKLCESACVTSTQRPYILPGVEIRAVPLSLNDLKQSSLITNKHLRSRVASAYFEMERKQALSHISKEGLASNIWCLGAEAAGGNGVPVAVVGRAGSQTLFLDAWTARRERMETPPRNYWAGRMAMRSWQIFLAQVLQFQCQLTHCIGHAADGGDEDPCADQRAVAVEAAEGLKLMMKQFERVAKGIEKKGPQFMEYMPDISMANMKDTYARLLDVVKPTFKLPTRWLIDCGIVELPSGGYLPVDNLSSVSVNDQVQRMMGEGVDLRFCVVRADYIPHALEEAQHMERICLLEGINNPNAKPKVDVLVPEGVFETYVPEVAGIGYEMEIFGPKADLNTEHIIIAQRAMLYYQHWRQASAKKLSQDNKMSMSVPAMLFAKLSNQDPDKTEQGLKGAARGEQKDNGGYAFYYAGRMPEIVRGAVQIFAYDHVKPVDWGLSESSVSSYEMERVTEALKDAVDVSDESAERLAEIVREKMAAEQGRTMQIGDSSLENEHYDMWLNLNCDHDPFVLSRGESSAVNIEWTAMLEGVTQEKTVTIVLEFVHQGTLVIEDVLAASPQASLRARLSGLGIINIRVKAGDYNETIPYTIHLNEQVYLTRSAGSQLGFTLSIPELSVVNQLDNELIDFDLGLNFVREWISATEATFELKANFSIAATEGQDNSDEPVEEKDDVYGNLAKWGAANYLMQQQHVPSYQGGNIELSLLSGHQRVNPDVLKPDNLLHDTSLVALGELGKALAVDGYVDSRSRLLFPPPLPMPDQLRVFAKHDWVMFHRRRDKQCGYVQPDEVASKPRRYRLLLVDSLKSKKDLLTYLDGLRNNKGDVILRAGYHDAGMVDFEAGLQTVLNSHSGLRSDWDNVVESDGAQVMLGAIASRGAAYDEGTTLAKLRLQRLSEVLAPVTPLDEEGKLINLNAVPDVLAEGESDGVIVMVTAAPVATKTVCHEVYRLGVTSIEEFESFFEYLQKDMEGALADAHKFVSKAIFGSDSNLITETSAKALVDEWAENGGTVPTTPVLVTAPDPTNGDIPADQPYQDQLARVSQVFGGSGSHDVQRIALNTDFSSPCVAVSIMVVVMPVYEHYEHYMMKAVRTYTEDPAAPAAVEALTKEVTFDEKGEVVVNEAFEAAVLKLREAGELIKTIDVVNEDEATAGATKLKAELFLAKLKEKGVAEETAKVEMRQPTEEEKVEMFDVSKKLMGGFILKL
jgi:hypothetical protein